MSGRMGCMGCPIAIDIGACGIAIIIGGGNEWEWGW